MKFVFFEKTAFVRDDVVIPHLLTLGETAFKEKLVR